MLGTELGFWDWLDRQAGRKDTVGDLSRFRHKYVDPDRFADMLFQRGDVLELFEAAREEIAKPPMRLEELRLAFNRSWKEWFMYLNGGKL